MLVLVYRMVVHSKVGERERGEAGKGNLKGERIEISSRLILVRTMIPVISKEEYDICSMIDRYCPR